jgi:predicted kinase
MMLGYPGAGKTYFARQFAKSNNLALIDADRLRFELFEVPAFTNDEDKVIIGLMDYMIEQFLNAGISIVIDGLNSTRTRRHDLRDLARRYHARPLVVWVQTDINTSYERAANRDRRQTDDKYTQSLDERTFETLAARVKQPLHEDYVVISGKHVFTNQLHAVARKIDTMDKEILHTAPKKVSLGGRVDLNRRRSRLI